MSADPDTGEIGKLRAGWPDPDGLTIEERLEGLTAGLRAEVRAELEKMMRGLHEQGVRASKGTYYRGGHGLVFLLGMVAAAEDGAIGRAEAAVRGALVDLAPGDGLAEAALKPAGGPVRDRLARALLPLVLNLWPELERRTGEALEARGVPWGPVVGRILAGERGQRESDREREREAGWPEGRVEIEPAPGLSYEQAAANDREDRETVAALGELRVPDPERPDAPELLAWDAWLAEWLRAGGAPTLAGEVLEAARRRAAEVAEGTKPPGDLWSLWAPGWGDPTPYGSLPVLATLAEVAWPRLRAELERERLRVAIVPALTVRTMALAVAALSPATVELVSDGRRELVGPDGRLVASLDDDDVARALATFRGAVPVETARAVADELMQARAQLASLMGFIHAAFAATALARADAGTCARWDTWARWAEEVGDLWGVKATPELRSDLYRVAWWGNLAQLQLFDGRTQRGLWTLTAPDPFKRGRPPVGASRAVVFGYALPLFPGWAAMENPAELIGNRSTNRGVRLLALPDPAELPTGTRDPSVKGRLLLYSFDLMATLAAAGDPEQGFAWTAGAAERQRQRVGLKDDVAAAQVRALKDAGLIEEAPGDRLRLASPEARRLASPRAARRGRDGKR